MLRSLSVPSSSESIRAELQPAQADVADAGAERVGDRRDAEPLRGRPRDDRALGAGVDDEVLRRRVVDLGAHDDLFVHQPESTV